MPASVSEISTGKTAESSGKVNRVNEMIVKVREVVNYLISGDPITLPYRVSGIWHQSRSSKSGTGEGFTALAPDLTY